VRGTREAVSVAPDLLAVEAGLRHVDITGLSIIRRRCGRGFTYLEPRGGRVDPSRRRWIEALAIPPAWTDVHIANDPDCHILATGIDDAGRRQYRYHPDFRAAADGLKFARMAELGPRIGDVRASINDAIASSDERVRLTALVTRLIDLTLLRVGTERYADEHDTYGASTLLVEHCTIDADTLTLCFTAKSGKEQCVAVADDALLGHIADRRKLASSSHPVFATSDGWSVDGHDVKQFLSEAARFDVSAKDLRTWGASATMIEALCDPNADVESSSDDPLIAAYDHVAARLGNTRTVARASYVAPAIEAAHATGSLSEYWAESRSSTNRDRAEGALDKILTDQTG